MTYQEYVYSTFRDFYEMENVDEIIETVEFYKIEKWINKQLEDGETLRKMYNMDYAEEVTVNCSVEVVEENEVIEEVIVESINIVTADSSNVDVLVNFVEAKQLVDSVGFEGFMQQFESKYGYNFYSMSNYWYNANDISFVCKLKGSRGDLLIGWFGVHN